MTSHSRAIRSKSQKIVKFVKFGPLLFLTVRVRDLTGVAASLMIEKLTPDLLRLSTTFYELSVVCNHVSKSERRQFGASGNQRI